MHPIAFNLKRAFHSFLNLTRRPFHLLGLTAARFDMLDRISNSGELGIRQSKLRVSLGVTAPTVTRMVRSLEQLGYVTRERCAGDGRQRWVKLTAFGRAILRRAWALLSGNVDLAFACALTNDHPWDEGECFHQMSCAEAHLLGVRSAFRDRATHHYAWHPDD